MFKVNQQENKILSSLLTYLEPLRRIDLFSVSLYCRSIKKPYIHINNLDPSSSLISFLVSCFHDPNFCFVIQIPQLLSLKNETCYNIHYLVHINKFSLNFY